MTKVQIFKNCETSAVVEYTGHVVSLILRLLVTLAQLPFVTRDTYCEF